MIRDPERKSVMIYGAGQAGEMAAAWLPGDCVLEGFIDGDAAKQGSLLCGVPVLSPGEALGRAARHPECIFLCVINREAAAEVRRILTEQYGFRGRITDVPALRDTADLRLAFLRLAAREIKELHIPGDVAELGVYRGGFARELNMLFPERELLLFDTFAGFDGRDLAAERKKAADGRSARAAAGDFGDTSVSFVRNSLPFPERAVFLPGYFPESLQAFPEARPAERRYCAVSLDTDLYQPTLAGLRFFYPRLSNGGVIIIHDYNSTQYPGVKRAVRDFQSENEVFVMPLADLHGTAVLMKS